MLKKLLGKLLKGIAAVGLVAVIGSCAPTVPTVVPVITPKPTIIPALGPRNRWYECRSDGSYNVRHPCYKVVQKYHKANPVPKQVDNTPAKAGSTKYSFEFRLGYHHRFEDEVKKKTLYYRSSPDDTPPLVINLEMRLQTDITEDILFAMRNNFSYIGDSRVSIEDGLYLKVAEYFGALTELHIDELMIPKFGAFFLRDKDHFRSYASAKIMPGDNIAGEFIVELGYNLKETPVMIYLENRTIVDGNGHRSSRQSLKLGYKSRDPEKLFGFGGNLELSESGDENVRVNLTVGVFIGVYMR